MITPAEVRDNMILRAKAGLPYRLPTIHSDGGRSTSYFAKLERNDCTVRSLANACEVEYKIAHKCLWKWGRKRRKGIPMILFLEQPLDESLNCTAERIEKDIKNWMRGEKLTLRKFLSKYPHGTYIVTTDKHALAVKDGIIYDNSDNRPNQWVKYVFKINKKG